MFKYTYDFKGTIYEYSAKNQEQIANKILENDKKPFILT